jgi:glutathione synthase/RimK-type ligase-like ATP-grasp enzyme
MEIEQSLTGCLPLFRMAKAGIDMKALAANLLARAQRNVDPANALMDLSWIFSFTDESETALSTQALALQLQQLYHLSPPSGNRVELRLLALMASGEYLVNTPIECLLEGSDVALDLLFLGPKLPFPEQLPEHDVLFIAIREADENLPLLQQIDGLIARCPGPVINAPSRIPLLARDRASALLQSAPGIVMPLTVRVERNRLESFTEGNTSFPIIVRAVGAHRGQDLMKLDDATAVAKALEVIPAPEFYVASFIDYRGADGLFRKYRIVLIDGRPYASHLAISDHWMINYINANMEASPDKRAEEEAFMARFDEDFAVRHCAAFEAIQERLGLDYVVLDCAETSTGQLLLFEVDHAAIVHANDPVEIFPYKQPQMRKVFTAFQDLLFRSLGLLRK